MAQHSARRALIRALRNAPNEHRASLAEKKRHAEALRNRADLVWFLLLQSASTHGNSRGYKGLILNREVLRSVSYATLLTLEAGERERRILQALKKAKVRMQTLKAPWLARNFELIEEGGGARAVTRHMLNLKTRDEKLRFVRRFYGIGEKYGRNTWMDIYDPSFRDSIAVDYRLKRIARALGFAGTRYCDSEAMFRALAIDANLQPWELDRLLYEFTDYYENAARGGPAHAAEQVVRRGHAAARRGR